MGLRVFVISYLLLASTTWACIHYPADFKASLAEGKQEFFLFHDGQNAHMVLRTELTAKKFPKEIAWILPFPSIPSKFDEVDGPLFMELRQLFPSHDLLEMGNSKGRPATADGGGSDGIKLHQPVSVGDYQIQPIEILDEKSGKELNKWLKLNKFNPMPSDKQKRYIKKGAAFLAIRMKMNSPGGGKLLSRPLHVTYKANTLSVPMLFTHDNRIFDIDIYVHTQTENKQDLSKMYLDRENSVAYKREHLRPMVEQLVGERSGWITLFKAKELNSKSKKLSSLKNDPSFPVN